jgi:hypothetical protein
MDDKDVIIAQLRQENTELRALVSPLRDEIARRKNQNSSNSTKPPSSDIVNPQPRVNKRKKRRRGVRYSNTPERIRTSDFLLRRQALYPLSYGRGWGFVKCRPRETAEFFLRNPFCIIEFSDRMSMGRRRRRPVGVFMKNE